MTFAMNRHMWTLTAGLVLLTGCERQAPPPAPQPAPAPTKPAASVEPAPSPEPISPLPPPTAPAGAPTARLQYTAPDEWKREPARSSMRLAQYRLPRVAGDDADGELVLFYFGSGDGGPLAANLERWRGQFRTADGEPVGDDAVRQESFTPNNLKVTVVDVTGRFAPRALRPGAADPQPKDDYRMFAAVVEGPGGPWFFKATGPQATMTAQRDAFYEMIKTIRK